MEPLPTRVDAGSAEFAERARAMEALVADLRGELAKAREGGSGPETPRGAEEDVRPRPDRRAARSGLALPRALADGGARHVRRRGAGGGDRHRHRPRVGPRSDGRGQRRHRQGRHVLSDDGQEAPARPGGRRGEPPPVRLPRRLRAARSSRSRRTSSRTASTSAGSSTTRRGCRRCGFRRSPWSWARARRGAPTCRPCRTRP